MTTGHRNKNESEQNISHNLKSQINVWGTCTTNGTLYNRRNKLIKFPAWQTYAYKQRTRQMQSFV